VNIQGKKKKKENRKKKRNFSFDTAEYINSSRLSISFFILLIILENCNNFSKNGISDFVRESGVKFEFTFVVKILSDCTAV